MYPPDISVSVIWNSRLASISNPSFKGSSSCIVFEISSLRDDDKLINIKVPFSNSLSFSVISPLMNPYTLLSVFHEEEGLFP